MMKKFLKAYWWAILMVLIAPVLLNFIILMPAFSPIVGKDTDWLSFHGSYIGSVIASLITLYVLYKQLQNNHEENEKTRRDNQAINEKNRQLQLDILKYEQEKQWLQEIRTACLNNIYSYNHNDVLEVCNSLHFYPETKYIMPKIKILLDRLTQTDSVVGFLMPRTNIDKSSTNFNNHRQTAYASYKRIINDIQTLANFINYDYEKIRLMLRMPDFELSSDVKKSVETMIITPQISNINDVNTHLALIAIQRSSASRVIFEEIRSASLNYIQLQKERINKLIETDGTR